MENTTTPGQARTPEGDASVTVEETLDRVFALSPDERLVALREIAIRVIPRLDSKDIGSFIDDLRRAPMLREKLSAPEPSDAAPGGVDGIIAEVMNHPLAAQKHLLELAAPRLIADIPPAQREDVLRELQAALEATEGRGETLH